MAEEPGFVLAPAAVEDIGEIWDFIAADSIEAADRVLDEFRAAMRLLSRNPKIGVSPLVLEPGAASELDRLVAGERGAGSGRASPR